MAAEQELTNIDLSLTNASPTILGDDQASVEEARSASPASPTATDDEGLPIEEPEELQYHEAPENPDMDPLESTVRRYLPIPKKYFWTSTQDPEGEKLSVKTRMWHYAVAALGKGLECAEFVGEVVSHALGLHESHYQYVIDGMSKEDWEKAKKVQEDRERQWEIHFAEEEAAKAAGVEKNAL
jgi:hypothetical protein